MKEIIDNKGEIYCWVSVDARLLKIKMNQGVGRGCEIRLDAKVIPQLRQALTEAEFFKVI